MLIWNISFHSIQHKKFELFDFHPYSFCDGNSTFYFKLFNWRIIIIIIVKNDQRILIVIVIFRHKHGKFGINYYLNVGLNGLTFFFNNYYFQIWFIYYWKAFQKKFLIFFSDIFLWSNLVDFSLSIHRSRIYLGILSHCIIFFMGQYV